MLLNFSLFAMHWKHLRLLTQFRLSVLFMLMYLVALYLARDLGRWFLLLLVQPLIIWIIGELLYSGVPKPILKASKDNWFRMDGAESSRRKDREHRALRRFRGDVYSTLINIALCGSLAVVAFAANLQEANPFESSVAILSLLAFWMVGGCILVQRTYALLLAGLFMGIKKRKEEYFDSDIRRLQNEQANEPASTPESIVASH